MSQTQPIHRLEFIGIDPGAQGAICLLMPDSIVFHPTPNDQVSVASVIKFFNNLFSTLLHTPIGIEAVHSMANMTAKSNFSFGYNLGQIETIAYAANLPIHRVPPKTWQAAAGIVFKYPIGTLAKNKSKIRKLTTATRALQLYPDAQLFGPKGGLLDGRADALMIAHYMRECYVNSQTKTA